jgi:hypothetical protein
MVLLLPRGYDDESLQMIGSRECGDRFILARFYAREDGQMDYSDGSNCIGRVRLAA